MPVQLGPQHLNVFSLVTDHLSLFVTAAAYTKENSTRMKSNACIQKLLYPGFVSMNCLKDSERQDDETTAAVQHRREERQSGGAVHEACPPHSSAGIVANMTASTVAQYLAALPADRRAQRRAQGDQ
jgi:hypothetical protein